MNKGIEILLARMESNPDEFVTGDKVGVRNWMSLVEQFEDDMLPEERTALLTKYRALRMDKFTELVMKELLKEKEEPTASPFGQAPMSGVSGQTQGLYTLTQQQANAMSQAQLAQQQQQLSGITATALGTGTSSVSNSTWKDPTVATLSVGNQTLTEKTLKKLKALIK